MKKEALCKLLGFFAKKIVKLYRPTIVGVTGSLGKTSAKDAIFHILKKDLSVRKSVKNYNNEIGVPLTIIGEEMPKAALGWIRVFWRAVSLVARKDKKYPRLLILEMGIDRPNDMDYLLTLARPDIAVLTSISPVHFEFFKRFESLVKEKHKLILALPEGGLAILNADDKEVMKVKEKLKCRVKTYGFSEDADVRAVEVKTVYGGNGMAVSGINFKLVHEQTIIPIFVPSVIGRHQVYPFLAAALIGFEFKRNGVEIAESLSSYESPPGRMRILEGIRESLIIDDTYNAAPESTLMALAALKELGVGTRKIAVLGDMRELGAIEGAKHKEVGASAAKIAGMLVTVGEKGRIIANAAIRTGEIDRGSVFSFDDSSSSGIFLERKIAQGDIILVKGSQAMRMEKCVRFIIKNKRRAAELLVRQDGSWLQ